MLSAKILVINFHISGRQDIGWKLLASFPLAGSFWHNIVLPSVIHSGSVASLLSILFNCIAILS